MEFRRGQSRGFHAPRGRGRGGSKMKVAAHGYGQENRNIVESSRVDLPPELRETNEWDQIEHQERMRRDDQSDIGFGRPSHPLTGDSNDRHTPNGDRRTNNSTYRIQQCHPPRRIEYRDNEYRSNRMNEQLYHESNYRSSPDVHESRYSTRNGRGPMSRTERDEEIERLERRLEELRLERDRSLSRERNHHDDNQEEDWFDRVNEAVSYYDGGAPLARQAERTQQRRNEAYSSRNGGRDIIVASRLDRYSTHSGSNSPSTMSRQEERSDNRPSYGSSNNDSGLADGGNSSGADTSKGGKNKKRRNKKSRGGRVIASTPSSGIESSATADITLDSDDVTSRIDLSNFSTPRQSPAKQSPIPEEPARGRNVRHSVATGHSSSPIRPPTVAQRLISCTPAQENGNSNETVMTKDRHRGFGVRGAPRDAASPRRNGGGYESANGGNGSVEPASGPSRGSDSNGGSRGDPRGMNEGASGSRNGDAQVTNAMRNLILNAAPAPTPFTNPTSNDQDGYKAAPKPASALRQGKKEIDLVTNVFEFEYDDRLVYRYDVSVSLEIVQDSEDGPPTSRLIPINKGPRDDASQHERHEFIREALKKGLEMYRILSESGAIAHDGSAMAYANESMDAALKPHQNKLTVSINQLDLEVRKYIRNENARNVVIEVCMTNSFNIKDLSGQLNVDRSDMDQSCKQFFEVITSADAVNKKEWTFMSGGKLYRDDPNKERTGENKHASDIGSGQERRPGMTKGFTVVDGSGDRAMAALNIDVTTGTFWKAQPLVDTVVEINGWGRPANAHWADPNAILRVNEKINNLHVSYVSDVGIRRDFIAGGVSADVIQTKEGRKFIDPKKCFTYNDIVTKNPTGAPKEVIDKLASFKTSLPAWPCVVSKRARRTAQGNWEPIMEYYPIDILDVMPNQRVSLKKQDADPAAAMIPENRYRDVSKALDELNLCGDYRGRRDRNAIMEAFGIRVKRDPLRAKGLHRQMPQVNFGGQRSAEVNEKASFRTGTQTFTKGGVIDLLFVGASEDRKSNELNRAVDNLVMSAKRKGMKIVNLEKDLVAPETLYTTLSKLDERRRTCPTAFKNIIFIYIEPERSKHHSELKLFERRFLIPTQHLTMELVTDKLARNDKSTMENVLMKLNMKSGGHNYSVNPEKFAHDLWMHGKTMFMGYDVWHPTGQSHHDRIKGDLADPSVVGFSFNGGVNADTFIGDYHYQEPTREKVNDNVLNARIKWGLRLFEQNNGCLPPLIIISRDGISEGQYKHGMDELQALREGAAEWAMCSERTEKLKKSPVSNYAPKFIFIIATKRHHKRLWVEKMGYGGKVVHDNMPAMTVVDNTITNPVLFEFFLQTHTPLQGQAKATRYSVLKDDVGTTADAMQSLMAALCFTHQVSANSISIPEPIYQSDEWAKRGASNYKMFRELFDKKKNGSTTMNGNDRGSDPYSEYNKKLTYWNTSLEKTRSNA